MSSFVYIASPYSHENAHVRVTRYQEAVRFLRWCLKRQDWAYSPIVQTHDAALGGNLPYEFEFWQAYDRTMIRAASGVYVLCIDGWRESRGIADEMAFCSEIGKSVHFFTKNGDADYALGLPDA